jgi:hypothetical protein
MATSTLRLTILLAGLASIAGCAAETPGEPEPGIDGGARAVDGSAPPAVDGDVTTDDGGSHVATDAGAECRVAVEPCTDASECCGDLACDTTTAGQVCCGNEGATCATTSGEDCCRDLLCRDGHCVAPPMCSEATVACSDTSECCGDLECGTTSLGRTCCGNEGASCATAGGEDCCGALLCIDGRCSLGAPACRSPCFPAPALALERTRLSSIGGSFLGICGDAAHTYGYHVPAARLPSSDYSMRGAANVPVCAWHACAIDIGMNWPASRSWLRWLIGEIRADRITGIAEVIGSYDGTNVRYWSDSSGWSTDGTRYTGSGHDSWTHVSIYRSTALSDHRILAGWTATGGP